ncbi:flagellar protein FlgN [Clostridium sp. D53t1_180928_C8]|uniref:flagellar protein FlgN n=1 Tax=Clostridium sp. D53t1_180928_C8 TaxID=2787101 RepID=UPI0018A98061|nr:flagellar protein FlgN [Clostridium sp. D53t1_180928_C8]
MNSQLKLVIFEEKKSLKYLLDLLEEQYRLILDKDIIGLEKITNQIEDAGRNIATIEINRRKIIKEEEFKIFIDNTEDQHIKDVYREIKNILRSLELQNNTNNTLLKKKLLFTTKMINVIKPSKGIGTYNSYGKV